MSTISNNTNEKKNKLTLKKIIIFIAILLAIFFAIIIITINTYLNKINKIDLNPTIETSSTSNNPDIENIAFFGIDEPDGTVGPSNCIMILTIDNKHKELKLSSIITNSYVTIPTNNKQDKISQAYELGGPKLALETLNENFNLNIDKLVTINFSSLGKVIDGVGGITLNIKDDELKYINKNINNFNKIDNTNSLNITTSGIQQIDGTQALAYMRTGETAGGDFERSQRERTVLTQLFEKSKILNISQYPYFLNETLPIVHTNLSKTEILKLAVDFISLHDKGILPNRFPYDGDGEERLIDGTYYYVFNADSTTTKIHNFIFENDN